MRSSHRTDRPPAPLRGPQVVEKRRGPLSWDTIDFAAADLITAIDGEPIKNADDFLTAIESKRPGDRVELTVVRDGQEFKVPVILGNGERVPSATGRIRDCRHPASAVEGALGERRV